MNSVIVVCLSRSVSFLLQRVYGGGGLDRLIIEKEGLNDCSMLISESLDGVICCIQV